MLLTTAFTIDAEDRGLSASFRASGDVEIEGQGTGTGDIQIAATDMGNRVTPLPPHDRLSVDATIQATDHIYDLSVGVPMVEDPLGLEPTWWGVAFGVDYREPDGDNLTADLVAYGLGDLTVDGQSVGRGLPVKIVASHEAENALSVEVGNDVTPIPAEVDELTATWGSYRGAAPETASLARYAGGGLVLAIIVALGLVLTWRRPKRPTTMRQTAT